MLQLLPCVRGCISPSLGLMLLWIMLVSVCK